MTKATEQAKMRMREYNQEHREERKKYLEKYYSENAEKLKEYKKEYYQRNKDKYLQRSQEQRKKENTYQKDRNLKLKKIAIETYGNKCACCGESELEFLAIDHIDGDGNKHRKTFTTSIYQWLKNNDYPKGKFRVLCHNCNMATRFGKTCPHKRRK